MDTKLSEITEGDFERSFGFLVHDVARLLRREFDKKAQGLGLTRSQWFVLAHLYRTDGQKQMVLAAELEMERAPLGKLLDRMEEGGWVERRPDSSDRRAKLVFRTEKFDPLVGHIRAAAEELYDVALKDVSEKDRETLIDALIAAKKTLLELDQNLDVESRSATVRP